MLIGATLQLNFLDYFLFAVPVAVPGLIWALIGSARAH
jgi:hypothetical protein